MKLQIIQAGLKVPKDQRNEFGNYKYRSCEDIVEAAKPLLAEHGFALTLSDELVQVGAWNYVKATATIFDGQETFTTTAFAREQETKKGMDVAQITGAASSYARKYALNGLLAIDDTRDADATNLHDDDGQNGESQRRVSAATRNRVEQPEPEVEPGDVIVHVGKTTKGKKVSQLTIDQLHYFAEDFTPKTDADKRLKTACLASLPEIPF